MSRALRMMGRRHESFVSPFFTNGCADANRGDNPSRRPFGFHHLKVLREAGLVERYKVGTRSFYHASTHLDRWGQLARVTSDTERFVRAMVALDARGEGCSRRGEGDKRPRGERR